MPGNNPITDSVFVRHVPCTNCGSSDGNSEYRDTHENGDIGSHFHCFVCKKTDMLSDTRPDYVPHSRNHIQESKGEKK